VTVVFVFFYACSDEIHQLFVLGREGAFRDVIIDTVGGITLILINLFRMYVVANFNEGK
jgi:VanZ family protein